MTTKISHHCDACGAEVDAEGNHDHASADCRTAGVVSVSAPTRDFDLKGALHKYAVDTQADNATDYDTAVRMMSDEPGEVMADLSEAGYSVTVHDLKEWIADGAPAPTLEAGLTEIVRRGRALIDLELNSDFGADGIACAALGEYAFGHEVPLSTTLECLKPYGIDRCIHTQRGITLGWEREAIRRGKAGGILRARHAE